MPPKKDPRLELLAESERRNARAAKLRGGLLFDKVTKKGGSAQNPKSVEHFGRTAAEKNDMHHDRLYREYRRNISKSLADVTADEEREGRAWYPMARTHAISVADEINRTPRKRKVSHEHSMFVLAQLNTNAGWQGSKTSHRNILERYANGEDFPYGKGEGQGVFMPFRKIENVLWEGQAIEDNLSGPEEKITEFFHGITGNLDTLTLDVWANRTTTGGRSDTLGEKHRRTARRAWWDTLHEENARREKAGLSPWKMAELQAAVWLRERDRVKSHLLFADPLKTKKPRGKKK